MSRENIQRRSTVSSRVKRIHRIRTTLSGAGFGSRAFFKQMPLLVAAPNVPFSVSIALIMNGHRVSDIYHYSRQREPLTNELISDETRQQSIKTLQENIYWMKTEQRCRHYFRRIVQAWLYKKYSKRFMNTEDPATLQVPKNPIVLYRPALRGSWVFEANSILKCIKKDLGTSDWLFPYPKHPRNPFTNGAFTNLECEYLFDKLRQRMYTHWKLEGFTNCGFSTKVFADVFRTPLKLSALSDLCSTPEDETTIEFVIDFIDDQMNLQNHTAPHHFPILRWAVRNRPHHPYITQWRCLFAKYTRYQFLYGDEYVLLTPAVRERLYGEIGELFADTDSIAELSLERLNQNTERQRIIHQNALRALLISLNVPQEPEQPIPTLIVLPVLPPLPPLQPPPILMPMPMPIPLPDSIIHSPVDDGTDSA
jgi:hypothetical protein